LTDSGGPLEFVEDGETGLVTPPDPPAVADAFDRLFADRALASRMGEAGRARLESEVPAWPEVVARLLA
jgi:glycosyltransferase involved in cell wall biosynthesis